MIFTRNDFVNILNGKIASKGCWKDFNRHYRIWGRLKQLERPDSIIRPNETVEAPAAIDYPDLDSNCEPSPIINQSFDILDVLNLFPPF